MTRFSVSFRIMGDDLDPVKITAVLGLEPHEAHRRGEMRSGKPNKVLEPYSEGLWALKSGVGQTASIEKHLGELLDKLLTRHAHINKLRELGYDMDFFIGVFGDAGNCTFQLPISTLNSLANLGIEVFFDIYALDD